MVRDATEKWPAQSENRDDVPEYIQLPKARKAGLAQKLLIREQFIDNPTRTELVSM